MIARDHKVCEKAATAGCCPGLSRGVIFAHAQGTLKLLRAHDFGSGEKKDMQRVAFLLRLKPGAGAAYDEAHQQVWPEMLALLKRAGISDYSIFRRDELLVLSMRVEQDFETTWREIESDAVNTRWQEAMGEYFAAMEGVRAGERFPMMQEVFYLP